MVPAVLAIPFGQAAEFQGIIDLVDMVLVVPDASDSSRRQTCRIEIPQTHLAEAARARRELEEVASRVDDDIVRLLLENRPVPATMLKAALRKGTIERKFTPVLCGSAQNFHGIGHLLDAVVAYLPSPIDRGEVTALKAGSKGTEAVTRRPDIAEALSALAFKTTTDKEGRDLVYVRIYSGELSPKDEVMNTTMKTQERIGHIYCMMGDRGLSLERAGPGDIVTLVGLKTTRTGHTLCAPDAAITLEEIRFPQPVISQAIIPDRTIDEVRLASAMARLVRDDPTLKFAVDAETKQLILSGMGELHLEVSVKKLQRTPGVKVAVGKPRVAYRQTLRQPVEFETRFIKQRGGTGHYAVITCLFEPLDDEQLAEVVAVLHEKGEEIDAEKLVFESKIGGGAVSKDYIPGVETGFRAAARKGVEYGYTCSRIRCTLIDGKEHEKDSSKESFQLAAAEALREAQARAGITLLEPIMSVVISAPSVHQGKLAGDINRRRGAIHNFTMEDGRCQIHALVPLAELFGYAGDLSNATGGTASFTMEPSHYAPVKEDLADLDRAS